MSYKGDVVAAAKALVRGEEANWELARLTWENTKAGGGTATQETWSADIRRVSGRRFSREMAGRYARLWAVNGTKVPKPSWTECWYEQSDRDRPENREARAVKRHIEDAPPAETAETVKKALERPEVARQIVADRDVNLKLAKARQEHDEEARAVHEAHDPELRDARKASEEATLKHELARIRNLLFASTGLQATEETVDLVRELIAAAQAFLDAQDFDAELANLIGGN